jgi:hypothetical protein
MFREAVVIDYITDYSSLTSEQITKILTGVTNKKFFKNCPNGTIIAAIVDDKSSLQKIIHYPFFSHIRLPIKSGERVWVFSQQADLVPYWLSRKVQNESADDLNFTHDLRADLYNSLSLKSQNAAQTTSSTFYDPNSSTVNLADVRKNSNARSEFIGEPIISVKSKSVDLTLQGSNGTAIVLTNNGSPGTGTVDIVAGLSDTIKLPESQKITNADKYVESVKPLQTSGLGTLKSDDSSRIVVSSGFNADSYYSLPGDDAGESPTISLVTDSVRIQARKDMKILVGPSSDPSSIILKSNGDIIITPSSLGIIKLGGEDATGAILASVDSVVTAGKVAAPSLVSTAGGILGAPALPATGIFSTKVLVKVT